MLLKPKPVWPCPKPYVDLAGKFKSGTAVALTDKFVPQKWSVET